MIVGIILTVLAWEQRPLLASEVWSGGFYGMQMSLKAKHGNLIQPQVTRFNNLDALKKHVASIGFKEWNGLTVAFEVMWHHNIGHALFDGLYPAYLAVCKFGLHAAPWESPRRWWTSASV